MTARPTILAALALAVACGLMAFEMRKRGRDEERDRQRIEDDAEFRRMMRLLLRSAGAAA